jgi:hypothetical protein
MEDDLARRLASVEPRHLAVDQRDVGVEEFDLLDSSSGIAGLTADLPVATKSEKGGDDAAGYVIIVGHEDAKWRHRTGVYITIVIRDGVWGLGPWKGFSLPRPARNYVLEPRCEVQLWE